MPEKRQRGWAFAIDRGGTFTDCIGVAPDGSVHVAKVLSSDAAPVEGIREILGRAGATDAEVASGRLGTTLATNALLERRGVPVLFVANHGLGDVLEIGTQERPELFALAIEKPAPLAAHVGEVAGRVGVNGELVEPFDPDGASAIFEQARAAGIDSVAISLIHAYAHPELEEHLAVMARAAGFAHVVSGHEIANEIGLLARGETASVDAYLTPLLRAHVEALQAELPNADLRLMQSSGGLTEAARFRAPFALLSGPAGGVMGARAVAERAGSPRAIGFDMGGTSTDVSLLREGEFDRSFETLVGGVRVKAPMLRIHTVAAGGGSLCRFDGFRLTVGPESAGSEPGPLCYGRADARELALTDVNFQLGRVAGDRFPFALHAAPVAAGLARAGEELAKAGHPMSVDDIAAGFVAVANASMAQAIAKVSVERGIDPRDCALVGFGGAAGQHVCAIARELGMRRILLHPFAGILSAYGIGRAEVSWDGQRDAGRVTLNDTLPAAVQADFEALEATARRELRAEGIADDDIRIEHQLDLRVVGTETPLPVAEPPDQDWASAFAAEHLARFGYARPGRAIEIVTARVRASAAQRDWREVAPPPVETAAATEPLRHASVWFPEIGRVDAPVYARESLAAGQTLEGPALLLEGTGTIVLDPGFSASLAAEGILHLEDSGARALAHAEGAAPLDPIRLEVFGNRFMSIAEQMGAVLRNTSVSTNIKERLDYSCAVFDADAGLVANAPHIPVHLGAMSETVRVARERFPDLEAGDVVVTNDPYAGGSHLPDVTVVTPVFVDSAAVAPAFFVASRGHHADIGGRTPGSMPADSTRLEEEGVCIAPLRLVRRGRFEEEAIREVLGSGRYPARNPDDNVAELEAMIAANRQGERLLTELAVEHGTAELGELMHGLQQAAAAKVAREIEKLPDGEHRFADQMDDGTPIRVTLRIDGARMQIDFAGSGAAHPGNLNAPRAVVNAAVIYVLRALVDERIPLNGGCLAPVEISVPPDSLLDPPPGAAVVGGNVETSQRIVDVLLGALGLAAASQGSMNNIAFGDNSFGYYETIGGGSGATASADGASGVHTHMTNTRITDAEVLEARYPVRLLEFALRRGSGGAGRTRGGDGLVRRYGFLAPVTATLLCERRDVAPWGLRAGQPGAAGRNTVSRDGARFENVGGRATLELAAGDELRVETPGGGGCD